MYQTHWFDHSFVNDSAPGSALWRLENIVTVKVCQSNPDPLTSRLICLPINHIGLDNN